MKTKRLNQVGNAQNCGLLEEIMSEMDSTLQLINLQLHKPKHISQESIIQMSNSYFYFTANSKSLH